MLFWKGMRDDKIKGDIALMDAYYIAQDIMFSKQKIFEFRDKPGKNLARILSEKPRKTFLPPMRQSDGKLVDETIDKLRIFHAYFNNLYIAESVLTEMLDIFFL